MEAFYLGLTEFLRKIAVEKLGLAVKTGTRRLEGWTGDVEFYLFKCPIHKVLVETYAVGYNAVLLCPICLEEIKDISPRVNALKI